MKYWLYNWALGHKYKGNIDNMDTIDHKMKNKGVLIDYLLVSWTVVHQKKERVLTDANNVL